MFYDRAMLDLHPRHLNLAGASNFRDLGGYAAKDGRTLRWRRIFRSNHLGKVTDGDIAVLRELGLKAAFDLRGVEERIPDACRIDGINVHSLPIEPVTMVVIRERLANGTLTTGETMDIMRDSYRNYVLQNTPRFRQLFAHLVEDHAPLVIHCTADKDRTGFASALILYALGVADDVIVQDYLLTNKYYLRDTTNAGQLPEEVRAGLQTVHETFLAAAFEAVRAGYGDIDSYIESGLGVGSNERATLERLYLND